jgi:hypothetical protein
MAGVEHTWIKLRMLGRDEPRLYRSDDDPNGDFEHAAADPEMVAGAWRTWRAETEFTDRYVAEQADLGVRGRHGDPLREVLVHLIEEYVRHNGHADFLRERIDGRVGQ